jgi:hypothetical protein
MIQVDVGATCIQNVRVGNHDRSADRESDKRVTLPTHRSTRIFGLSLGLNQSRVLTQEVFLFLIQHDHFSQMSYGP